MHPIRRLLDRLPAVSRAVARRHWAVEPASDLSDPAPRERFMQMAAALDAAARVLEVGTKRTLQTFPTHCKAWFPQVPRGQYVMADIEAGTDVDLIADLHDLPADWINTFDAVVAVAVFEHLQRPWVAAKEVARVLRPGGVGYVATHQSFPLHAYPSDYFRFSREALRLIFEDAGLDVLECAYEHRATLTPPKKIVPPQLLEEWNAIWPSYICVHLLARKL